MTSFDLDRFVPRVSRPWVLAALLVWSLGLALEVTRTTDSAPEGEFVGTVVLSSDVFSSRYGEWAIGKTEWGSILLDFDGAPNLGRGDIVDVTGEVEGEVLDITSIEEIRGGQGVLSRIGVSLREATLDRLDPLDNGRALLAGFLIGDTSSVDPADVEAMRSSGLAHFVAVSGSNVALFLLLLALMAGPLALGPRRRAVVGLAGLPFYTAITRFEPSVMRASAMAAIALGGRLLGVVLEAWQLLSVAVIVLVVLDPALTGNIGFQLSVAATAGVIVGARWPATNWLTRSLAVTLGAQVAVAPLLLAHFGTVPLMSPLTNLVSAPVVGLSTTLGAVGLLVPPLLDVAGWLASLVLLVARTAAGWPQLSGVGLLAVFAVALLVLMKPSLRPAIAIGAAGFVVAILGPNNWPPDGSVVVLDVGQGDAILVHGGDGRFALVDGGPDPVLLERRLREHGVSQIEFVILTHVHADHATGLGGVMGRLPIGRMIANTEPHETAASSLLFDSAAKTGLDVDVAVRGQVFELGSLQLRIEGPLRRYASPNDQSVVVTVSGSSKTMLLSGDIETFAQADLVHLRADILKVPHQGAATSDSKWLASVGARTAVISVGPNNFGHPSPVVIDTLEKAGALVLRTDRSGDVVIDLS